MSDRPFGIDVSVYQGFIRWGEIAAHDPPVLFASIRATIAWGYQDKWFPRNWGEAGIHGIYRAAYHVVYPKQDALQQMDNFYKVASERGELPRVLDFEVPGDGMHDPAPAPPEQRAETLWNCSEIVNQRDGMRPIIYSRYAYVNPNLKSWTADMLNAHFWWLAQYLLLPLGAEKEHPGPPTLPDRVDPQRVIMHQTADKIPGFGVDSATLDRDRWLGTEDDLHRFVAEFRRIGLKLKLRSEADNLREIATRLGAIADEINQ